MARKADKDARSRILDAALEIFAEQGFAGTTTREIAARAKVNLGLIKYYFDSKDALWRAVVDGVFGALAAEAGDIAAQAADGREGVRKLIVTAVRFAGRNPAFVRLMNDECKRKSARMRWLVDRHGRPFYKATTSVLARLRRDGVLPDVPDVHLYYMFIGAMGMLFSQAPECERFTGKDPTSDRRMIDAHADAVANLFLGRSPAT
jgi:AcrR family transcriptional regulator